MTKPARHPGGIVRWFEDRVRPTGSPVGGTPPASLWGFFRHHLEPVRFLVMGLFIGGFLVAVADTMMSVFLGRIADFAACVRPSHLLEDAGGQIAVIAAVALGLRPVVMVLYFPLLNQAVNPGLANLIRWRSHY
jgi:ATP-binding cassette subfamily B multidrug efflux pump